MIKIGAEILGGYSLLPPNEYMISYMKPSGEVDWDRLNVICQRIADAGASYVREFPYWPTSHGTWNKYLTPFWMYQDKSVVWNNQYFENWLNIFRFMKEQYNLTPVFVLFNASETRVAGKDNHFPKENSPWNYFKDFFYSQDAESIRHEFIGRILYCAGNAGVLDIMLEMVNEPAARAEPMMSETLDYLVTKRKFPMNQIITGWDIHRIGYDGVYAKAYRAWKKEAIKMLTKSKMFKIEGETKQERDDYVSVRYLKGELWTTMHAVTSETLGDYFGPNPKDLTSRNQVYSTDGERLDYDQAEDLVTDIIDIKSKAISLGKVFISILIGKESHIPRPYAPLEAACDAAIENGYDLDNYSEYPVPLPLPRWIFSSNKPPVDEIPPIEENGSGPDSIQPESKKIKKPWIIKNWRWIVGISSALLMAGLITFAPWYLGILGASQLYALRHFRIIK